MGGRLFVAPCLEAVSESVRSISCERYFDPYRSFLCSVLPLGTYLEAERKAGIEIVGAWWKGGLCMNSSDADC